MANAHTLIMLDSCRTNMVFHDDCRYISAVSVSSSQNLWIPQVSAILAIEEFAHRFPAGLVPFGVQMFLGRGSFCFRLTAAGAAVGKTGLVRLQLKIF